MSRRPHPADRGLGAVARVRDRDVHDEPIPYLGGLAMLGGLVAAYLVARELPFLSTGAGEFVFRDAGVVIGAGALICAVGVLDDLFELDALTKLGGQLLAAGFLVAFGVQFYFFTVPGGEVFSLDAAQGALLTGFLVIATVNAVNFVDGLDGLAAGVVGIGALAFFLYCYQLTSINDTSRATTAALLTVALAGACAGFLPHNINPARLFMGDSGSMLIGLVLSAGAGPAHDGEHQVEQRDDQDGDRQQAFAPDKQHLHHRLLEIGHSQRRAVFIMWLWAGLVAFGTVLVSLYSGPVVVGGVVAATVLTVALTFLLPRLHRPGVEA